MWRLMFILLTTIFSIAQPAAAQSYEFTAEHEHMIRNCRGKLVITPEKIEYQTNHKDHSRQWLYTDLQQIKVESPKELELVSYEDQKWRAGLDRIFKFKLREGEITSEVSALLVERATRPMVTSVRPTDEVAPTFETPVKHLHRFGGCLGTLKIYPDQVIYEAKDEPEDSRFWRYSDIRSFGLSDRYRFEITTFEDKFGGPKSYNFQLREELPRGAYDYVWARVYPSRLQRGDNLAQPAEIGRRKR